MRLYKLPVVLYEPSEDTEDKYMAEVPILSGCRAWGDSPSQALENLHNVARAFIQSYKEQNDPLPPEVDATAIETKEVTDLGSVLVAG